MKPSIYRVRHINILKKLRFPPSDIIFLGSATLAAHGLVENKDIDLMASKRLWNKLRIDHEGMNPVDKHGRLFFETLNGEVEISDSFVIKKFTFDYLKKGSIRIDGYHFMSFKDLIELYETFDRPKDRIKLKIIRSYLEK